MGETTDQVEKNEASAEIQKKEKDNHEKEDKHEKVEDKEKKKDEKTKDKKNKKSKENGGEDQQDKENGGKEKKKKNPEDKKDPGKLKLKLEKIDAKMQAFAAKKEEILNLLKEVEQSSGNSTGETCKASNSSPSEDSLAK